MGHVVDKVIFDLRCFLLLKNDIQSIGETKQNQPCEKIERASIRQIFCHNTPALSGKYKYK